VNDKLLFYCGSDFFDHSVAVIQSQNFYKIKKSQLKK